MKIFTPLSLDGFELCHPENQEDFETIIELINGEPRRMNWLPLKVKILRDDEGINLASSDAPWLGSHALIFRPSAIKALTILLEEYGEVLDLCCSDGVVSIYNPTRVLDALDEEASSVLRFNDGRIMRIVRYVLRPEVVNSVHIFKIPNLRNSPTFVSEKFVALWESANLKGLTFKLVWEGNL